MFGRRPKPQQFDYEPIYYDKEAADRQKEAESRGHSRASVDENHKRLQFVRPPQLRKGASRYTLFVLVLVFGLLAYMFIWLNQFSSSDLPIITPEESIQ
jgi:hypothetical protein